MVILGWCDKNVYRSWNKCAVSGKCYTTCTDGNCYEEVKNSSEEIKVNHSVYSVVKIRSRSYTKIDFQIYASSVAL